MAKVVLENVFKIYRGDKGQDVLAVDDFNLEIGDQEFVVFVGPSGCGKTTTLRMIAGLEEISRGKILIDDKVVNDVPPKNRDIAMVFQNYALYPHMSVYKNMAFGLELRHVPRAEIDKRVQEAAEILKLTKDELERKPKALSGGQRQRVALGRAIVRKPKVFLFDEPLSNLDAKMRVEMRTEISKLHTKLAATMIYVTHDQVEAMTMADRIVVMSKSKIQQVGEPLDIYNNPANKFVAEFIGSPPMNFFKGSIVQKNGALYFQEDAPGSISLKVDDVHVKRMGAYTGKSVYFGIRPEDIEDKLYVDEAPAERCSVSTVEVAEPMGAETFLYLSSGKTSFIARCKPHAKHDLGNKVDLVFNTKKSHFFDMATEQVIR
ncbi:sn-glycerol-3-phosphate ABC transporter ATP-binding protein UgpC [Kamptonema cortianum]|nr:sn-glycerol-3-phosphate ABC transporter ATP-binding protein UgpC [Oscillatoria laete-virens]MDK3157938.1 sn-glycerol-3-phosphate ABC transporter ATP-binding protein UgpC [Kamptonema cortianum]MDL5046065.1 sn-glycerol-3-phosphate ABC transporter ATP-binding protein UgpC [Oscillatoria amoena NRMC-F 0135]MDL5052772.1 sn-glycerol-3-phosphate ABC transporter ATP-binding protein UgpC [Oscillatoria laete-virens NRMC-F 0139]